MSDPNAKTLQEVIQDFRNRASGARMAASVSAIKTGSKAYSNLMSVAQTWDDAALILSQTTLKKGAP